MRVLINIVSLVIYLLAINYWIYTFDVMPIRYSKILFATATVLALLKYKLTAPNTFFEHQFNDFLFWAVIVNFCLLLSVYFLIINNSFIPKFIAFNGGTALATIIIAFSAYRHGHFKNE